MRAHRLAARVVGLGLFAAVLGCSESNSTPPPASPPRPVEVAANTPTDAKGIFEARCTNCHATAGIPQRGKGRGPDLTHVGGEPGHTADWIAEHIRNPRAHKPESKMPAFEGKLTPEQIKTVSDFLAAQK
jgi:mono/diheme cytochrome c family protein